MQDISTWVIPHNVTVSELNSRLSSAGVHPIFLLTNASLYEEYRALVQEIGFGAVVAVDEDDALADNYNDNYLPYALERGLEVCYGKPNNPWPMPRNYRFDIFRQFCFPVLENGLLRENIQQ